jgi:hypothetical protein
VLFCQTRIADVSSFNGATLMPRPGIDTTAEPDFVAYVFGDDMIAIAAGVAIAGMATLRPIPAGDSGDDPEAFHDNSGRS